MFLSKVKEKKKKSSVLWTWGPAQQRALDTLEEKLYSRPVRAYADFKKGILFCILVYQ